ncbi:MAG: hypothetical protein P3X24_005385 [bacterium]|nr:hypothetical protein [bacterium]
MPIIETVEQLVDFLEQNAEWRHRLFAILAPRALQRLPEDFEAFREETNRRFNRLERKVDEGFARVDREFENVRSEMRAGFERVDREMREGFERVDREMREGFERQGAQIKHNTDDIAQLKGLSLEHKYREQARSWFSKYLRKIQVVSLADLEERLPEGVTFSDEARDELSNADLLLIGTDKRTGRECVYVMEVSWVVDASDVERAVRRARWLIEYGFCVAAVAAGHELAAGADALAQQLGCGLHIDGRFVREPMGLE